MKSSHRELDSYALLMLSLYSVYILIILQFIWLFKPSFFFNSYNQPFSHSTITHAPTISQLQPTNNMQLNSFIVVVVLTAISSVEAECFGGRGSRQCLSTDCMFKLREGFCNGDLGLAQTLVCSNGFKGTITPFKSLDPFASPLDRQACFDETEGIIKRCPGKQNAGRTSRLEFNYCGGPAWNNVSMLSPIIYIRRFNSSLQIPWR